MAMPKKFPNFLGVRLSDQGKAGLKKKAKEMGVKEAVAGRIIIEHTVIPPKKIEEKSNEQA